MGSTMSNVQEELIREHFAHVVVMLDGDEAGGERRKGLRIGSFASSIKWTSSCLMMVSSRISFHQMSCAGSSIRFR